VLSALSSFTRPKAVNGDCPDSFTKMCIDDNEYMQHFVNPPK
jgi:hypothetical protein